MNSNSIECFVRGIMVALMSFAIVIDAKAGTVGKSTPTGFTNDFEAACAEFETLTKEIGQDFSNVARQASEKKITAMLDLASFIVEPLESVGTNHLPRCRALRAEVEKLPPDSSKEALLAKIAATSDVLEKFQNHDFEGLADLFLHKVKGGDGKGDKGWSPLALSLVSTCEFPSQEKDVCGIRLNLLGGTHHDVSGVDVGVLCNSVSNGAYGVQVGGVVNSGACDMWGIQFAGLVNIGGWNLTGMQAAGLVNLSGEVCGAQLSGLCSIGMKVKGSQISGGGNMAGIVRGCQIGGIGCNVALVVDGLQIVGEVNSAYRLRGLQCSALANSGNILDGVQLSAINLANTCRGVQIGAINKSRDMAGLQIGVINCAKTMTGCQIGVCNVIQSSSVPVLPVVNMSF